jgi:hypothetical protein
MYDWSVLLADYFAGDESKNEMGGACSAIEGER